MHHRRNHTHAPCTCACSIPYHPNTRLERNQLNTTICQFDMNIETVSNTTPESEEKCTKPVPPEKPPKGHTDPDPQEACLSQHPYSH
mmetsp:Transcript_73366/g.123553  ORF Transcript_73366/g.123553 Transcript_73366/m.123553 type:complete len:87 (+) Transcript_73366:338-598(+)